MDSNNQSDIVKKYWEGESSIKEEQGLRDGAKTSDSVATEEENYFRHLANFSQLKMEQELTIADFVEQDSVYKLSSNRFRFMSAAAIGLLVVMSTIFYLQHTEKQKEVVAARIAFEEARQSLLLMSSKLNKGTNTTSHFTRFNVAQQKIKRQK